MQRGGHYPSTQHNCIWARLLWAAIGILGSAAQPGAESGGGHGVPLLESMSEEQTLRLDVRSHHRHTRCIRPTHNYQLL